MAKLTTFTRIRCLLWKITVVSCLCQDILFFMCRLFQVTEVYKLYERTAKLTKVFHIMFCTVWCVYKLPSRKTKLHQIWNMWIQMWEFMSKTYVMEQMVYLLSGMHWPITNLNPLQHFLLKEEKENIQRQFQISWESHFILFFLYMRRVIPPLYVW